jgi:hypothetical protein
MFSYFLKANLLALIISGGACHAEKAWFGKNSYTCPDLSGGLIHQCKNAGGINVCNKAAQWINENCKSETDPINFSGVAYFPNTTCVDVATQVFNEIDADYQNAGYDYILQNCEDKK